MGTITTCIIATDKGPATMVGEVVGEHFIITPAFDRGAEGQLTLTGAWTVPHLATGHRMSSGTGCISCCLILAAELEASGADWSAFTVDNAAALIEAWPRRIRLRVRKARDWEAQCPIGACPPRGHRVGVS